MDYDSSSTDSDDERLEDEEERLLLQVIHSFVLERDTNRRFKLHNEKVVWPVHVNALKHSREFGRTYRMPYSAFVFLVDTLWEDVLIDEVMSIRSTRGQSSPVYPELVVAIGLRWLAGSDFASLRDWAGISTPSFNRYCDLFLAAVLKSSDEMLAISWPTNETQLRRTALGFQNRATDHIVFQDVVGAIDGYLPVMTQPVGVPNPRCYYSGHYECYGLNVQAVCDADLRFTYMGIGGPGSMSDVTAFRGLSISDLVAALPEPYHILGDAAYVPTNQLLTPFTGAAAQADPSKDIFNF